MEALSRREWTQEEYRRAAEAGVFRPDERLELVDGQILKRTTPQGKSHSIDDDLDEHPRPEQVMLLIKVANSTLTRDLRFKVPRYALAGIPEVWPIDVEGRRPEIHREHVGDGYGMVVILGETKDATPLFAPEARVTVADLLPGRRP